jgi:hypothetical protein
MPRLGLRKRWMGKETPIASDLRLIWALRGVKAVLVDRGAAWMGIADKMAPVLVHSSGTSPTLMILRNFSGFCDEGKMVWMRCGHGFERRKFRRYSLHSLI